MRKIKIPVQELDVKGGAYAEHYGKCSGFSLLNAMQLTKKLMSFFYEA